jgi:hypothetical protein
MGKIEENYRLPMVRMRPDKRAHVEKIASSLGLIT